MTIKDFLKEWKPKDLKKMKKEERVDLIHYYFETICEFMLKNSHKDKVTTAELFTRMNDLKFAKTLKKVIKKNEDCNPVMALVIGTFVERNPQKPDDEIIEVYADCITKLLKEPIKKVAKKTGMSKEFVAEVLAIVPTPSIVHKKNTGVYVNKLLRKLYFMAKEGEVEIDIEDSKSLKKLLITIFGEDNFDFVLAEILLERKDQIKSFNQEQLAIWNTITDFALETLEKKKKKELKSVLEFYISRRKFDVEKDRDSARRTPLLGIVPEDYPKLSEVISTLAEKENMKKYL